MKEIESFIARLKIAQQQLMKDTFSKEVLALVSKRDLLEIFNYLLNEKWIVQRLALQMPFRVDKDYAVLPRTMNILRESNGEYILVLEVKTKVLDQKDKMRLIAKNDISTVKAAWRLDVFPPQELTNKTVTGNTNVQHGKFEADFARNLINNAPSTVAAEKLIHLTLLGAVFFWKKIPSQGLYSLRAICDLLKAIKGRISLTVKDISRITRNILDGVALIHSQRKVHQDLKPENILIFQDGEGYYAKINDFNLSHDPALSFNQTALASPIFASPEIFLAHEDPASGYHKTFYSKHRSQPYGFYKNQSKNRDPKSEMAKEYRKPHPANDMWALGVLFFELQDHKDLRDDSLAKCSPLIQGLLKTKREERFIISEAIASFEEEERNKSFLKMKIG